MNCRSRRFNARVYVCATMLMFLSHILQLFAQEDPALRKLKLSKRYKSNIQRLTRGVGGTRPETHPRNGVSPLRPVSLDNIVASPKSKVKSPVKAPRRTYERKNSKQNKEQVPPPTLPNTPSSMPITHMLVESINITRLICCCCHALHGPSNCAHESCVLPITAIFIGSRRFTPAR